MFEIGFIAYILSLVSLVVNIYLWFEIKEMKAEKKREMINRRLKAMTPPVVKKPQTQKPYGHWG